MKINTKIRYALRTIVEIAIQKDKNGILQKDISRKQEISNKYLDQIIAGLKAAGLIINSGGKKSGYILLKNASEINVYDIYRAFEPDLSIVNCLGVKGDCKREPFCASKEYWCGLNDTIINYLQSKPLIQLAEKQEQYNRIRYENMYYI